MGEQHVMVDLETMGTGPTAAIVAIGATVFDPDLGVLHGDDAGKFYENVSLQSSIDAGLTVTGETVMWWLSQSHQAREALQHDQSLLFHALANFRAWFPRGGKIWSNGASFDIPILENAFLAFGATPPWAYNAAHDMRTIKWLAKRKLGTHAPEREQQGTTHHALDDAISQAQFVANSVFALMETHE